VRHVVAGEYVIAKNTVLPAGWVGYFPESAYYGPQVKSPSLNMITLQYGGPSGLGFYSVAQRKRAMQVLRERGEFTNGIYSSTDATGTRHNLDAGEAVWAEVFGSAEYPPARYDRIVLIDPGAFEWRRDEEPGVWRKHLGTFSEREVKIALVRVDEGSRLILGREPAAEIAFLKSGTVELDGADHAELSAFGSRADDAPAALTATTDCELLYVKLPTFAAGRR
jgi:hypothetical protein